MAERSRAQWLRAVRRWATVGAVVGAATALVVLVVDHDGHSLPELLGYVVSFVLMGATMGLVLWGSAYKYDFARVWGWPALGATVGLMVLLGGSGIGMTCLLGACGER